MDNHPCRNILDGFYFDRHPEIHTVMSSMKSVKVIDMDGLYRIFINEPEIAVKHVILCILCVIK